MLLNPLGVPGKAFKSGNIRRSYNFALKDFRGTFSLHLKSSLGDLGWSFFLRKSALKFSALRDIRGHPKFLALKRRIKQLVEDY